MTFKSFFWLVRRPNTQKMKNLTWVNMWLGSSLTYNPCIFLFLNTPEFGRGEEWAFPSQKYWNTSVLTIDLFCFYFKKFIFRDNWGGKKNTLTHTFTHRHTTPHHTHNLDLSADYGVHPQLFMFEFDSHQVLSCLLLCYVHQLYFQFKF